MKTTEHNTYMHESERQTLFRFLDAVQMNTVAGCQYQQSAKDIAKKANEFTDTNTHTGDEKNGTGSNRLPNIAMQQKRSKPS